MERAGLEPATSGLQTQPIARPHLTPTDRIGMTKPYSAICRTMLLCLSSRQRRGLEEPVEVSGEVAFEAAGGLAAAFPFLESSFDVVDGRSVCSASGNDDLVECSVELSVAAAVEPVADRLA